MSKQVRLGLATGLFMMLIALVGCNNTGGDPYYHVPAHHTVVHHHTVIHHYYVKPRYKRR